MKEGGKSIDTVRPNHRRDAGDDGELTWGALPTPATAFSTTESLALVVFEAGTASVLPLASGDEWVIGRAESAHVRFANSTVSRVHAVVRGGVLPTVEDLGSSNGTRVDGVALARGERRPLRPGSVISFGQVAVSVQLVDAGVREPLASPSLVMEDPRTKAVFELAATVAPSNLPVLIVGETGVGKELVAEHVHACSDRASQPLLRINCAALPESLLESELFGHERGAFTGATTTRAGLLESANGGTLFLDEVGETSLATQAKLLRFLESGEVLRVGGIRPKRLDVRVIGATNRDLERLTREGKVRADFYHRLNGVTITVPPLRARALDIVPLARAFLRGASLRLGRPEPSISADLERALVEYRWPGNVRELRKVLDRATVLSRGAPVERRHLMLSEHESPGSLTSIDVARALPPPPSPGEVPEAEALTTIAPVGSAARSRASVPSNLRAELEQLERERILACLQECGGNQSRAAELLGITRRVLMARMDAYGISRPRKRQPGVR